MFYNAIHVRRRKDGKSLVLAHSFSVAVASPDADLVAKWLELRNDPRIGAEFTHVHRILDNAVAESFSDLPHPDVEAERAARLRTEQAEAEARENAARIARLRAEIASLEAVSTPEAVIVAQDEAEAARKAAEEAAAEEARVAAEAAAAEEARLAAEAAAAEEARVAAFIAAAEEARLADAAAGEAGGSPAPAPVSEPASSTPSERKGRLQPAPVPPV